MRMWVHLGSAAATKVVYGCPPDWPEMQAWKRLLRPGDLFIDVGANVGTYSLWAAGCGAEVIAVEPDAVTAQRLRDNVALNPGAPISCVEAAAADREGTIQVTEGQDTLNRIGPGREVKATTLDALAANREVAGIKIDVEGFERLVLEGASRLLTEPRVRVWQLEWNSASTEALGEDRQPAAEILRKAGYLFVHPDDHGRLQVTDPSGYGADIFGVLPAVLETG
jgi:FkbM family methyltransferase